MLFDWAFALEILPQLARAAVITIEATFVGFALAAVLGLVLALLRRSRNPWVSMLTGGFVEFIRSTPVLIQIFFMFYVFPQFGVVIPAFTAGVLALGIHYASYCSEVYRAGLEGLPRGQWEAETAKIIGSETFRYLEPITMVGVFFLIMSLISSAAVQRLEWWLNRRRG
jgi:polar amino acid transport system permease protein